VSVAVVAVPVILFLGRLSTTAVSVVMNVSH